MKGMKNMKKSGAQTFMTRNPKHAGRQALSFLAFMSFMTFIVMPFLSASQTPKKGITDWPMWGGSPDRNMVSDATGLPTDWDVKTGKNIKCRATGIRRWRAESCSSARTTRR